MSTTPVSLLVRLRRLDDQAAWERFVRLYTPMIFGWARRTGLAADAAGELVQDVFAILVDKLPQFAYDPQRSFRAWLKTVTLNRWREQARRRRAVALPAGAENLADSATDGPSFLEAAEYREQLVRRAMRLIQNDFGSTTWQACWQYVALDRKPADVAEALGISVNSVYLAKSRVLRRLREELDGLVDWGE